MMNEDITKLDAKIVRLLDALTRQGQRNVEATNALQKMVEGFDGAENRRENSVSELKKLVGGVAKSQEALTAEFTTLSKHMETWSIGAQDVIEKGAKNQAERNGHIEHMMTTISYDVKREMSLTREFVMTELEKYQTIEAFHDWEQETKIKQLTFDKSVLADVDARINQFVEGVEERIVASAKETFTLWEKEKREKSQQWRSHVFTAILDILKSVPWQIWVYTPIGFALALGLLHIDDVSAIIESIGEFFGATGD